MDNNLIKPSYSAQPDTGGASIEQIAFIARETANKVQREMVTDFIQFGTVASSSTVAGEVPYATVHMDGDNPDSTIQVSSLVGAVLYPGLRVAVIFDRPHGAYIIGSPSVNGVPAARGEIGICGGEEGGRFFVGSGITSTVLWPVQTIQTNGATVQSDGIQSGVAGIYRFSVMLPYSVLIPSAAGVYVSVVVGNKTVAYSQDTAESQGCIVLTGIALFGQNDTLIVYVNCNHASGIYIECTGHAEIDWISALPPT